jgi:hypothetical protein
MRYRYCEGGLYELVCMATLEADLSGMVVYRGADGSIWTRPQAEFFQMVEVGGERVARFAPAC